MPTKLANQFPRTPLAALLILLAPPALCADLDVSLTPSIASPAPVGTLITWTATAFEGVHWYRFSTRGPDSVRRIIKDFGPESSFDWAPYEREGSYEIQVEVRNTATGETGRAAVPYHVESNAPAGGKASIRPTVHPLVYLYSAPPCKAGDVAVVYFVAGAGGELSQTPAKICDGVSSMNFLIAGLRHETRYLAKHVLFNSGGFVDNPVLEFTPAANTADLPVHRKVSGATSSPGQRVHLAASLFALFVATDLDGNVIWYYPKPMLFLTSADAGGYFFGIHEDEAGGASRQIMRVFDLTGTTVLETNAGRVSEQLIALGKRPISAFHHEARRARNGNILVLASVERILTDVQGPGPVNVLGDMIIELNRDLEVVWTWDTFDHLDVRRMATQGDLCTPQACPPFFLSPQANDWVHGNSVSETADGYLLYSARSQDWIVKIDYQGGSGGGNVVWRLGRDGDFQISSGDLNDWFSHQHDAEIEADGTMSVFDNGNVRRATDSSAQSRGQVFRLNEANRRAEIVLNANLGHYAFALGSAQRLDSGHYIFDAGYRLDSTGITVEVSPRGEIVYAIESSAPEYRTFRLRDMYNP
ncbi:MAG: aryl-sulfate sulfotransferase [Bryobacteraceae bacterium]